MFDNYKQSYVYTKSLESEVEGSYNQPNKTLTIPSGMHANVLSAEFYMT